MFLLLLALGVFSLRRRFVFAALVFLVLVLLGPELIADAEFAQYVAHLQREFALVVRDSRELVQGRARLALNIGAPGVDHGSRVCWRSSAGEPLAHHERNSFRHRRLRARLHAGRTFALQRVSQRRGEIVGDALHRVGAQRLHAHLLHRVKHRARIRTLWAQPGMLSLVMVREPQRQRVRLTTNALGLRIGNHPRRVRQHDLAGGQARAFRAKRHLQIVLAPGKRARRLRERAFEGFGGSFTLGH